MFLYGNVAPRSVRHKFVRPKFLLSTRFPFFCAPHLLLYIKMKGDFKMKIKHLTLAALILPLALTSCASNAAPADNSSTQDQEKIIEYYKSSITKLEEEMNELKEESYILCTSYKLKIRELENYISSIKNKDSSVPDSAPGQNINAENYKSSFDYAITEGGVIIKEYIGQAENVTVPASIDGRSVTKICESAFADTAVRCVVLPDTLLEIDWFAFRGCTSLEKIYIPSSVTSIGYGAFDLCSASLKIYGDSGSYAEKYAKSFAISFEAI